MVRTYMVGGLEVGWWEGWLAREGAVCMYVFMSVWMNDWSMG